MKDGHSVRPSKSKHRAPRIGIKTLGISILALGVLTLDSRAAPS
jgi:hypothetical protein